MRKIIVLTAFMTVFAIVGCRDEGNVRSEIAEMLDLQVTSWNEGRHEGYMSPYLRSDALTFHSGKDILRGWTTLDSMYREKYSGVKRGILGFSEVEIEPLSERAAYVLGCWQVERADTVLVGRFTLIVRMTEKGWRIVHDHSS